MPTAKILLILVDIAIVYGDLQGTARRYLCDRLSRGDDMPSHESLRSSAFNQFTLCPSRPVTIRERSCPAAGSQLWDSLPDGITSASSLTAFRRKLKTFSSAVTSVRLFSLWCL